MALTGLHTTWQYGSYQKDRDYNIKGYENAPLRDGTDFSGLKPHKDSNSNWSIAIGYGYDLLKTALRQSRAIWLP